MRRKWQRWLRRRGMAGKGYVGGVYQLIDETLICVCSVCVCVCVCVCSVSRVCECVISEPCCCIRLVLITMLLLSLLI